MILDIDGEKIALGDDISEQIYNIIESRLIKRLDKERRQAIALSEIDRYLSRRGA